jgi:putative DNA primase/helicase
MAITKAEAEGVARLFLRDYPGALELAYKFRDNTAQLYGPRAVEVPQDMKGGYVPKETTAANGRTYRGRVDVPLDNVQDARDLLITLRHEVLGHYGANTFAPAEKRALLDGVIAGREEPTLKPLWDDINERYAGTSLDMRAEEVIALQSEGIAPRHHVGNDQVQQRGQQSFKETCIARVRPMGADDLHNIVCMVAQGLHDRTRTQQTFPEINELFRRDNTMEPKKPFHEVVAEKLIEQLKAGTAPWQKPWQPGEPNSLMPMNPTTGKRYKGINAIHLMAQGRDDSRWMTYKQAGAAGAQVRKGEKGTPVQYWKFSEEQDKLDDQGRPIRDANGEKVKQTVQLERPRVFFATVFNAEQIDGLPPQQIKPKAEQQWDAVERAEHILQASGARISHSAGDRAFYRPSTDSITLPEKSQFESADRYYATALHELGHWTGHPSRLDRDLAHPFGSEGYAKEELRAEISSMIVGDELGIGHDPEQHAAYVGSWIKALQDDPLEIFRASSDAEKIHDYVLAFEQKQVQEQQADLRQPHEMTLAEFAAQATTEKLENHGRQWNVTLGDRYSSFSDAENPEAAIADVHRGAVNNALYLNTPGAAEIGTKPTFPPAAVLAEYPDLVAQFPEARAQQEEGTNMQTPINIDSLPGRLVDRLADNGIMSRPDAEVTSALRDLHTGTDATRAIDSQALDEASQQAFGFTLPADWSGLVQVQGNVMEGEGDQQSVTAAASLGVEPEFYGVYARREDGTHQWLADFDSEQQADELAQRLAAVDAHAEVNDLERAAKLARVHEERVRRDPNSTDEDISAAKEARKDAEATAMLNDADLQRRIAELERDQQAQAQGVAAESEQQKPEREYINVPFKEKDEAKGLGARWDRQQQSWYVPAGVDAAPFAKWAQGAATAATEARSEAAAPQAQPEGQKAAQGRTYLAVPYAERGEAKAAGALWDKAAKSWYAGPRADLAKLERWNPENVSTQQGPAMTPREEFAEAMKAAGLQVGTVKGAAGDHPIMDGKKHRVPVEGGKAGALDGFYVGHLDGHPAGRIINNKTGTDVTWKSKGYALSDEEKAKLQAEAATKLAERSAEIEKQQEATAQRVGRQMDGLTAIEQPTPYLEAKGIKPQAGALTDKDGQKTYIPAFDVDGKQWTMQYIQEDGTKRFAKDSKKEGCFHPVGGMDALAAAPALVISEGYATAASNAEALGFATVAAFDSGNLPHVARALHEKYPDKPIIIAGDDDKQQEIERGHNPGRAKAEEAAQAVGGKAIFPIFAPGEQAGDPKGFTDFNDLANKSELGREGVKRQVTTAVGKVLIDVGQEQKAQKLEQEQKREQKQEQRPKRAAKIG